MSISQLMMKHEIERIVYRPPTELLPHPAFFAWPIEGGGLDHFCGRGPTAEAAIHDCVARRERRAA